MLHDVAVTNMNKRPNILYVLADQLRYDTLGCTGNKLVKTPYIDRLASEGILMDNAFSASPICGPYRDQLLTGRYCHANGVMDNEYRLWDGQPRSERDDQDRKPVWHRSHQSRRNPDRGQ